MAKWYVGALNIIFIYIYTHTPDQFIFRLIYVILRKRSIIIANNIDQYVAWVYVVLELAYCIEQIRNCFACFSCTICFSVRIRFKFKLLIDAMAKISKMCMQYCLNNRWFYWCGCDLCRIRLHRNVVVDSHNCDSFTIQLLSHGICMRNVASHYLII